MSRRSERGHRHGARLAATVGERASLSRRARPWADERGASGVVVGICIVMLVGFAAFAVDLGNAWATRRHVVVASDAAALAAAAEYALGGAGCAVAPGYVSANFDEAEMVSCTPGGSPGAGWVRVDASAPAHFAFAGIFGFDSHSISSSTTAEYDSPERVRNLRPFGVCLETPELSWIPGDPPSGRVRIPYANSGPTNCEVGAPAPPPDGDTSGGPGGVAAGNWGVLDFDAGSNSTPDLREWVEFGYDGWVSIGDVIDGDPGAISNSLSTEMEMLIASGEVVGIPVYDTVDRSGSNADFTIAYFAGARFLAAQLTGPEEERWIEVEFDELVVEGSWTGSGGPDTGVRSVHICDTDDEGTGGCGGAT